MYQIPKNQNIFNSAGSVPYPGMPASTIYVNPPSTVNVGSGTIPIAPPILPPIPSRLSMSRDQIQQGGNIIVEDVNQPQSFGFDFGPVINSVTTTFPTAINTVLSGTLGYLRSREFKTALYTGVASGVGFSIFNSATDDYNYNTVVDENNSKVNTKYDPKTKNFLRPTPNNQIAIVPNNVVIADDNIAVGLLFLLLLIGTQIK